MTDASDESGFLAHLATAPTDDTARMAFADWLGDRDRWTRASVLALVTAYPANDGVRLLAADVFAANGNAARAEMGRYKAELQAARAEAERLAAEHDREAHEFADGIFALERIAPA